MMLLARCKWEMYPERDLCEEGQEIPVLSRVGRLQSFNFSDNFYLGMMDSSDEMWIGRGR